MKKEDIALGLASQMASMQTDNFSDLVVRTAEIYKDLTGKDIGIESFKNTRDRIENNVAQP